MLDGHYKLSQCSRKRHGDHFGSNHGRPWPVRERNRPNYCELCGERSEGKCLDMHKRVTNIDCTRSSTMTGCALEALQQRIIVHAHHAGFLLCNVKDDGFEFGVDGNNAFDAVGPLLLNVGCFPDVPTARSFFQSLATRFAPAHSEEDNVRSLATPMRMGEGMSEETRLGSVARGEHQAPRSRAMFVYKELALCQ